MYSIKENAKKIQDLDVVLQSNINDKKRRKLGNEDVVSQ